MIQAGNTNAQFKSWDEYAADQRYAAHQELLAIKKTLQQILRVQILTGIPMVAFCLLFIAQVGAS